MVTYSRLGTADGGMEGRKRGTAGRIGHGVATLVASTGRGGETSRQVAQSHGEAAFQPTTTRSQARHQRRLQRRGGIQTLVVHV